MTHNFSILAMSEFLYVVAYNDDTTFNPLVLKNSSLYDPKNNFKPIDPKPNQKSLTDAHREIVKGLMPEAKAAWEKMQAAKQAQTPAPAQAPAAAPAQTVTPQSTLDALIAESVAKLSLESVMAAAKPALDTFIQTTYGVLPKSIEVKTPTETHKVQGITGKYFETALKLVGADIPTFLAGPAGCGKNVICKQVAEALGLDFYFSNAVTQEYKLTGFIDANGNYQKTQFFEAFTKGGLFMLDEIDASTPEVLIILNAAIANRYFDFPCGRFDAHEDFRIMAAGNTFGTGADAEYTGRFQLDASSLDRFAILEVSYEKDVEMALAKGNTKLLDFIYDFREAVKKSNILFTISYRAIERLATLSQILDSTQAVQLAVLRGMEKEDAKMVYNNMSIHANEFKSALYAITHA